MDEVDGRSMTRRKWGEGLKKITKKSIRGCSKTVSRTRGGGVSHGRETIYFCMVKSTKNGVIWGGGSRRSKKE